jgi:hypothetical protein
MGNAIALTGAGISGGGGGSLSLGAGLYYNAAGQLVQGTAPNPGNQLPSLQTLNQASTFAAGWTNNNTLALSLVTGNPLTGSYTVENNTGNIGNFTSPPIQCIAGQSYYAQFFVRCGTTAAGDVAQLRIMYQNAAGGSIGTVTVISVSAFSTTSTEYGAQFTVPATVGGTVPSAFTVEVLLNDSGDGNPIFCDAVALVNTVTNAIIGPSAIQAANLAVDAIAVGTTAIQANALIDGMIASVGINKLAATTITQGTAIFTGTVVLSQGSSAPCLTLTNSSLTLFSAGTVTSGVVTGLTSDPFVQVESTGVLVAQNSSGPSVLIGVPSGGAASVTVYSANGSLSSPYIQMSAALLTLSDGGSQYMTISAGSLLVARTSGSQLSLSSLGLVLSNGGYTVSISNTGVAIVGGNLTNSANNALTTLNNVVNTTLSLTVGLTVEITSGTFNGYQTLVSGLGFHALDAAGNATVAIQTSNLGDYGFLQLDQVGGSAYKIILDSSAPSLQIGSGVGNHQVVTVRQSGPGAPSGFADSAAQTWCDNLYLALSHAGGGHGLIA